MKVDAIFSTISPPPIFNCRFFGGSAANFLTSSPILSYNRGNAQQPLFHPNDHEPLGSWFESTSGSFEQKLRLDGKGVEVGEEAKVSSRSSFLDHEVLPTKSSAQPQLNNQAELLTLLPSNVVITSDDRPEGEGGEADGGDIRPFLKVIPQLSHEHQHLIEVMVRELAKAEGIELPAISEGKLEPLGNYIPAWLNSLNNRGFSPGTIDLYQRNVERFFANVHPPYTTIAIEGYIASRREKDRLSPTAAKNDLKAIKSLFSFLHKRKIIVSDPAADIEHPKIVKKEKVCPTESEMAKFLAVLALAQNPRAKMMLALFITTGIRFDELVTLTWGKVDLETPKISVLGKGGKWRNVRLQAEVRDFLAEQRDSHTNDELLFPTKSKTGKWDRTAANRMIARLCRRAGIKKYSCHQFRHYFATHTLRAGARVKVVQELLGHAQASTTLDFYDHTTEEEVGKAYDTFAPLLSGVLKPKKEDKGGKHGKTT